jgi:small conductance mechanosensitive channel
LVIIPNNAISNSPYKNFSLTKDLRVVVDTSVAYDSDLKFVEEVAEAAITKQFPYRASDFEFYYMSFGDSAINIQLRFWIQAKDRFSLTKSRSQAIVIVKDAFELNGIDIPFPIRSLYVTSHDDGKNPLQ